MIKGLSGATIWSEDLNKLLPFYRDVLGLTARIQTPGFVVFGEAGARRLSRQVGRIPAAPGWN